MRDETHIGTETEMTGVSTEWQAVEGRLKQEADELVDWVEAGTKHVSRELGKLRAQVYVYDMAVLEYRVNELYQQLYALVAEATHGVYCTEEVESWCRHAELVGGVHPRLTAARMLDLIYYRVVPNAPLRQTYEAMEEPAPVEIAQRVHEHLRAMEIEDGENYESEQFMDEDASKLAHKVQRVLGLVPHMDSVRLFIPYEWAVAFARALDIDPRDCGI
jgi:hypothetical protein